MHEAIITDRGHNNHIEIDPSAVFGTGVQITLTGNNNRLRIGADTVIRGGLIELRNHDSSITIGAGCNLTGAMRCRATQSHIRIGAKTTMMQGQITLHEAGTVSVGADCMLSGDIAMDVSDMHSILDRATGKRINPPKNITIGDHVWLAQGVRVMKGALIGSDSIIGSRSMVLGHIPAGSLAVGTPARIIRSGVTWDRRRLPIDGSHDADSPPANTVNSQA